MVSSSFETAEQTVYGGGLSEPVPSVKGLIPAVSSSPFMAAFDASTSSSDSRSALAINGTTLVNADRRRKKSRSADLMSEAKIYQYGRSGEVLMNA